MKKTFKTALVLFVLLLCFAGLAHAEGVKVQWNMDVLTEGELSVELTGAENGLTAVLALYDGDRLVGVSTKAVENSAATLGVTVKDAKNGSAKLMLWSWNNISPASAVLSMITPDGITPEQPKVGDLKISAWIGAKGEEGKKLPGAAVTVKQGETEIAKAETDENGECLFEELSEGEYTVGVADPAGREAMGENPITVAIVDGETKEADFIFKLLPGSVTGVVWNDADRDGKKGEGEEPMSGVKVKLGETVVTTGEDGTYKFDSLTPADYTVTVDVPEDYILTTDNAAVNVSVHEGETIENNVGLAINVGSIYGIVWIDADRDGKKGAGEEAMPGVTVAIGENSVTTDENGAYKFEKLAPDAYTVTVTVPEDYICTTGNVNKEIIVVAGEDAQNDVGLAINVGAVTGVVWNDADGDGKKGEDEEYMPGVTVTIGGNSEITDENGAYKFEKLASGNYTVTVSVPEGMKVTTPGSVELTVEAEKTAVADFGLKAEEVVLPGAINGVVWNDTNGDGVKDSDETGMSGRTVTLTAEDGTGKTARTATDGTYSFEDLVPGEYTLSVNVPEDREATLENPRTVTVIGDDTIIENFGFKRLWISDDQQTNYDNEGKGTVSVAYHKIETDLTGDYRISFELTVKTKGDNAILIGDESTNGNLVYGTSSAILLFNSDYFSVRDGNGKGDYSSAAANLCTYIVGKTYNVTFEGNIAANTYTVTITDEDGKTYTSGEIHARKNGSKLDTIALISNSHKDDFKDDVYSNFYFYIKNFHADEIVPEPEDPTYNGFAGQYYAITVNGLRLRGNNGQISADNVSVTDRSNVFLPRYMGDGSYAFVCMSWGRRITTANRGSRLTSADYDTNKMNNLTQHWILEEGPSYTEEIPAYYLKSADNGLYVGLSGGYLTSVDESNKAELIFNPLSIEEQSPLYKISRTEAYAMLTSAQRKRIEEIYESVAGDAFGRYGAEDQEYTFRKRLDNTFNKILDSSMSAEEGYEEIYNWFFADPHSEGSTTAGKFVITDGGSGYTMAPLPGTENLRCELDEGTYGNYDFWRGTMLDGTMYKLKIYNGDELQQTIDLYVHDDGVPQQNSKTFLKAIVKIPYVYRKNIKTVKIRSDTANSYNCGATDMYIRLNWSPGVDAMAGTISHELSHSIDQSNGSWSQGGGWDKAMKDDMFIVSPYANSSKWEDFAEFGRLYFLSYNNQDRQKAIQILFPNRYASYWRLRNNNLGGFALWEDTEYLK